MPFCDHRLVEYVFNAPWSMKKSEGPEKSLLRKAAGDLLPQSVLERPKAAFPATQDERYDEMLRTELGRIVASSEEPAHDYVDVDAARALLDGSAENGGGSWSRLRVESVIRTNAWLEEYQVDMDGI